MTIIVWLFLIMYFIISSIQKHYINSAREHLKPEFKEINLKNILKSSHLYLEDEAYEDEEGLMYRDRSERLGKVGLCFFIAWIALLFSGIFFN